MPHASDLYGPPSPANDFHARHIQSLLQSHYKLTGRHLIHPSGDPVELARQIQEAPYFVASHGLEADPVLNYGNQSALNLFEMSWEDFTNTPSRFTAEAPNRDERAHLLKEVSEHGYIDNYSGVRISSTGQRFLISKATVWNVYNDADIQIGQAATFTDWELIN